ncbi:hypothetical protein [Nocardiopsis sp. FR26]|uniref:hypothetical protein n=1 Tax=Nocardiopsis sp. FR26 TaxID=2605987 RepID=UPI00135AC1E5|nr:hypothetical protein [Nocardiopsis sp. FR26]
MTWNQLPADARHLIARGHDHMMAAAGLALPDRDPEAVAEWDRARALFDQACEVFGITPDEALDHL